MQPSSLRATYLLLVALLLPMGTVVLSVSYFARLAGGQDIPVGSWAFHLLSLAGGLSAAMAVVLTITLIIVHRQRERYAKLQRKQASFLDNIFEQKLHMARNLDVMSAAYQVTLAIKQETSFERIASVVLEQIEFFTRAEDVVVFGAGESGLVPRARRSASVNYFGAELASASSGVDLAYQAMSTNRLARAFDKEGARYAVALPYASPDGIRGVVLIVRDVSGDPDFEDDLQHFEASLAQLVKLVSLGLKFSALWDRAIKDEMTGLFNKNHFNKEIPRYLAQAQKNGTALTLIMLDIDKFKQVNDTFGHLPGDMVLRQVAQIMIENLRETDFAFRYGGEELSILCTRTVDIDAGKFAERLRSIIAHTEFRIETGQLVPISVSMGVAEFDPVAMQSEKELKEACDRALYAAKENGRNLVVVNRGQHGFAMLDRTGDVNSEVKRRLGLAGDNTPLADAVHTHDRRADPKPGKAGVAQSVRADAAAPVPDGAPVQPASHPSGKKRTRRGKAKSGQVEAEVAASGDAPKPKKQRRNGDRRKAAEAQSPEGLPERRQRARRGKKKDEPDRASSQQSATLKAIEALDHATRNESDESDRLDFITDAEAATLLDGGTPRKSMRREKPAAGISHVLPKTTDGWQPKKHW